MANGHDPSKPPQNPGSGSGTGTGTGTGTGAGTGTGSGGGITPMDDHKPPQAQWWLPPRWVVSPAVG